MFWDLKTLKIVTLNKTVSTSLKLGNVKLINNLSEAHGADIFIGGIKDRSEKEVEELIRFAENGGGIRGEAGTERFMGCHRGIALPPRGNLDTEGKGRQKCCHYWLLPFQIGR